jgi:hypothetical protein
MPSTTAAPRPLRPIKKIRVAVRTTRPAVVDLRFREDAWVVAGEGYATVRLGDYQLGGVAVTSLDVPALNRLFLAVRLGQARRQVEQKRGHSPAK